jgi:hypothetical protein
MLGRDAVNAAQKKQPISTVSAGRLVDLFACGAHKLAECIARWRERAELEREIISLNDVEFAVIGVDPSEIRHMLAPHPMAAMQLNEMITRLGFSEKGGPIDDQTYDNLYLTCVMCAERNQCRNWLASACDPKGYGDFCPNSWLFDDLLRAQPDRAPRAIGL